MYKNRMQVRMIIILIFHCSIILFVLVKEDLHVYGIIFGVGIFMTIFKCNS